MDLTRRPRRIDELIDDLTKPQHHPVHLSAWHPTSHRTTTATCHIPHPSLLDQVREQIQDPTNAPRDGATTHRAFDGKSPVSDHALYVLILIEAGAAHLVETHGQPLRATVEDNLRALVGIHTRLEPDEAKELTRTVNSWRTTALVAANWTDQPIHLDDIPCLACGEPGELRVVFYPEGAAWCGACRETWDTNTIGLLGEYVAQFPDRPKKRRPA
jgi:hypothetical protein